MDTRFIRSRLLMVSMYAGRQAATVLGIRLGYPVYNIFKGISNKPKQPKSNVRVSIFSLLHCVCGVRLFVCLFVYLLFYTYIHLFGLNTACAECVCLAGEWKVQIYILPKAIDFICYIFLVFRFSFFSLANWWLVQNRQVNVSPAYVCKYNIQRIIHSIHIKGLITSLAIRNTWSTKFNANCSTQQFYAIEGVFVRFCCGAVCIEVSAAHTPAIFKPNGKRGNKKKKRK